MLIFRRLQLLLLFTGMAFCHQTARAQITATPNGYDFHMGYMPAQQISCTATISSASEPNPTVTPMALHVLQVSHGIATIEATIGTPKVGGRPRGIACTLNLKVDDKGRTQIDDQGLPLYGLRAIYQIMPPHPLRVGESCSTTTTIQNPGIETSVTDKLTLKGFKTIHGARCAALALSHAVKGRAMWIIEEFTARRFSPPHPILTAASARFVRTIAARRLRPSAPTPAGRFSGLTV